MDCKSISNPTLLFFNSGDPKIPYSIFVFQIEFELKKCSSPLYLFIFNGIKMYLLHNKVIHLFLFIILK